MPRTHTFDRIGRPIPDPWTTLGVPRGAPPATIRVAYRALVRAPPPESDPEAFRSISAAYRLLTDPEAVLERHLGELSIGSPADYGLAPSAEGDDDRTPREIVAGELLLYALAEAFAGR